MIKLISTLLIIVIVGSNWLITPAIAVQRDRVFGTGPLILEGQVTKLEKDGEDSDSIGFRASILLTFKNVGTKPVIIYRHNLWLGAISLSRTIDDAHANRFLLDKSAWPSIWGRNSRSNLYKALDQPSPPTDFTLVISPGQSWEYQTVATINIDQKDVPDGRSYTWDEIRNSSPVWLQVTLEMWPVNAEPKVDPDNPEFGMTLRRRWKRSGELWLNSLTSEPMLLDFSTFSWNNTARQRN